MEVGGATHRYPATANLTESSRAASCLVGVQDVIVIAVSCSGYGPALDGAFGVP